MTTIAWDGRTMACDSMVTEHHGQPIRKIFKIGRYVLGGAGDLVDVLRARNMIRESGFCELDGINAQIILVDTEFLRAWTFDDGFPIPIKPPYAIGSGGHYAMGAMDAGAEARDALKIARNRDDTTGGRIITLKTA